MKLKTIMYTLGYGKSEKAPLRSEGARRVAKAHKLLQRRTASKSILFPLRYGSFKQLSAISDISLERKKAMCVGYKEIYGSLHHRTDINNKSIDNLIWCGNINTTK